MNIELLEKICRSNQVLHVRISSIEFFNFRNIEHGRVDLPNSDFQAFRDVEPSILGLYGQNGSGKTSVIMALSLLKRILTRGTVDPDTFGSCIRYGHERCSLKYSFSMMEIVEGLNQHFSSFEQELFEVGGPALYKVEYGFDLTREEINGHASLIIENEYLATKPQQSGMSRQVLFDTSYDVSDKYNHAFGNKAKYKLFIKNNTEIGSALNKEKSDARAMGCSFLFSSQFIKQLENSPVLETYKEDLEACNKVFLYTDKLSEKYEHIADFESMLDEEDYDLLEKGYKELPAILQKVKELLLIEAAFTILYWFPEFGENYLHVIDTSVTGVTTQNEKLPLLLWNWNGNKLLSKTYMLDMNDSSEVSETEYPDVERAIIAISKALSKIVPDVSLQIMGETKGENHSFSIESVRGSTHLPLKYESDGIRRIVSVLSLLIAAYNQQTFTVAIDEIDSCVFEYLLGVILNLMGKSAKGQLIFTSHNLRPLEVLPDKFLCFTTVNPVNRFTYLKKRGNSNLRDCYYRSIVLGNNEDSFYHPTDQYDIEVAFLLAGKKDELV